MAFRRPRFGLRSLLLAMIPLGFACLWLRHWLDNRPTVWRPYSPELVTEEVAQGRTVVVLFMAQWDPNGYLNLRFFERSSTLRRYSRNPNVAFLIADCTEESAEMEQTMRKLGFRTVPATVIFRPGVAEPRVLMDIVSAEQLLEELNKPAHSGR